MRLTRKVVLYPNSTMKQVLELNISYRRYVWNKALTEYQTLYSNSLLAPDELKEKIHNYHHDKTIEFTEEDLELMARYPRPNMWLVRNNLVSCKEDWEYARSSRVLQLTVAALMQAWKKYFSKSHHRRGKPKYKTETEPRHWFKTDRAKIVNGKIRLDKPKAYDGEWYDIPFRGYDLPDGKIIQLIVTRVGDKYTGSIIIDVKPAEKTTGTKATAVDANINKFVYTDGIAQVKPQRLEYLYNKIDYYSQELSRKKKINGKEAIESKSYQATQAKLQKVYKHIANIQNDLLHKFTTKLVTNYDTIVIEDLDVEGMRRCKKVKNVQSALFGRFRIYTTYKSQLYGKKLILADRYYPSTQRCSACGYIKKGDDKLTLAGNKKHKTKHSEYVCYECGYKDDRDHNAMLNLLALAQDNKK